MASIRTNKLVPTGGHWSEYYPGTGFGYRYRHCARCNQVWRNNGEKPLIMKGRTPRG